MNISSIFQHFQNSFEHKNPARNSQDALLLIAVLVGRLVEKLHEDGVVEKLGAYDEALHFLTDVDGEVALRDSD